MLQNTKNVVLLLLLFIISRGYAQDNIVYPAGAKIVDVTKPPFNADPTGILDATAAIQAALDGPGNIVYLPNGTYLVSNTINWPGTPSEQKRHTLQGQSKNGTIIKLVDNATGYSNASATKTVIYTGMKPAQRFQNYIKNLTVNTGSRNPGATGIQFIANNVGGMYNVLIKSNDGNGVYGLDLGYTDEQGPCLIKNIEVDGFNVGIRTKHGVDGVVMEGITLSNQKITGILNEGQCLSIRDFKSTNVVKAISNTGSGMLALVDATITGTGVASNESAIFNSNGLFARNIKTVGYKMAIQNIVGTNKNFDGADVDEFVSHAVLSLFPSPLKSLNLPIEETPEVPWGDVNTEWGNIEDYGPATDTTVVGAGGLSYSVKSWHKAFQKAIDAGHKTIYMPTGATYQLVGDIHVRHNVERIIGLMREAKGTGANSNREIGAKFIIDNGTAPVVVIENFNSIYSGFTFEQKSTRKLVVRNSFAKEMNITAGKVYLEDMYFDEIFVAPGTELWARQLNLEGREDHVNNNGGLVWVLGIKTEDDGTVCVTKNGGSSEIIGGFIYANKEYNANKRMFQNFDSKMSVSVGELRIRNQAFHPFYEERDGEARLMTRSDLNLYPAPSIPTYQIKAPYGRGGGAMLPLFVSYKDDPNAVENLSLNPNQISIFPNPIDLGQSLNIKGLELGDSISFYDVSGKQLYQNIATSATMILPTPLLMKGIIMVTIQGKTRVETRKVVVL